MKVALVHDWLTGMRGGERVLLEFLKIYPEAEVLTLVHVPGATNEAIDSAVKQVSWLGRLPNAKRWYRHLLPLYPLAVKDLNLNGYDLVISLSHAAAKNITIPKGTKHLCYCFTPMRYIWDQSREYFGAMTPILSPILLALRLWDKKGAKSVSSFSAISSFIKARIRCYYHRDSAVIYPPVNASWIKPIEEWFQGEAFLYAGALVPYKRPDVVVEAFNSLGLPLWIAGTGPLLDMLKEKAHPNIVFLGSLTDPELSDRYRRCRALIFPGIEDFGMIPIECMAAGRPVIGIFKGGIKETIRGLKHWKYSEPNERTSKTGVFIKPGRVNLTDSLISSVCYFIKTERDYTPKACQEQAAKFSPEVFRRSWKNFSDKHL